MSVEYRNVGLRPKWGHGAFSGIYGGSRWENGSADGSVSSWQYDGTRGEVLGRDIWLETAKNVQNGSKIRKIHPPPGAGEPPIGADYTSLELAVHNFAESQYSKLTIP